LHVKHGGCGQPGRPELREQEGGREHKRETEQAREKHCRQCVARDRASAREALPSMCRSTHHEHRAQSHVFFLKKLPKTMRNNACNSRADRRGEGERSVEREHCVSCLMPDGLVWLARCWSRLCCLGSLRVAYQVFLKFWPHADKV